MAECIDPGGGRENSATMPTDSIRGLQGYVNSGLGGRHLCSPHAVVFERFTDQGTSRITHKRPGQVHRQSWQEGGGKAPKSNWSKTDSYSYPRIIKGRVGGNPDGQTRYDIDTYEGSMDGREHQTSRTTRFKEKAGKKNTKLRPKNISPTSGTLYGPSVQENHAATPQQHKWLR